MSRDEGQDITIYGFTKKISPQEIGGNKCCIHTRHSIPLNSISLNWISREVSVNGQTKVVRTVQSGSTQVSHCATRSNPKVGDQMTNDSDKEAGRKARLRVVTSTQKTQKTTVTTKGKVKAVAD